MYSGAEFRKEERRQPAESTNTTHTTGVFNIRYELRGFSEVFQNSLLRVWQEWSADSTFSLNSVV
jgi:hypothetical protein